MSRPPSTAHATRQYHWQVALVEPWIPRGSSLRTLAKDACPSCADRVGSLELSQGADESALSEGQRFVFPQLHTRIPTPGPRFVLSVQSAGTVSARAGRRR